MTQIQSDSSVPENAADTPDSIFGSVMERNIQALMARRQREEKHETFELRLADNITRFAGSMRFVYLHLALFGLWIVVNLGWLPVPKSFRFDPSFVILAMFASVEAIFLSTFILISQNRMTQLADKRADLDLQVNLLTEHELTRLIHLVTQMAGHIGMEISDPDLHAASQDVKPEHVLDTIEAHERRLEKE